MDGKQIYLGKSENTKVIRVDYPAMSNIDKMVGIHDNILIEGLKNEKHNFSFLSAIEDFVPYKKESGEIEVEGVLKIFFYAMLEKISVWKSKIIIGVVTVSVVIILFILLSIWYKFKRLCGCCGMLLFKNNDKKKKSTKKEEEKRINMAMTNKNMFCSAPDLDQVTLELLQKV